MNLKTRTPNQKTRGGAIALALLTTFACGYWISRARAAGVPATTPLTYSGVLSDMNGVPLAGSKNIQLQLYGALTGGTALCSSAATPVTLVGGAFQVPLGDGCTPIVHAMPDLWIDVLVDGASLGRAKLGAVPYALEADHAQTAATLAAGPIAGGLVPYNIAGTALAPMCVVAAGSTAVVDCTCPAGSFVAAGGGDAGITTGHFLRESRAMTTTTWRTTCATAAGADALCNTYHVLCSRVGP